MWRRLAAWRWGGGRDLDRLRAKPWAAHEPTAFEPPPTMLSGAELRMLHWLASEYFRGRGEIVDAGCFLGGSTAALADGLARNPRVEAKRRRIHSYDTFALDWYAKREFFADSALRVGDSFFDLWRENVARWAELIAVHRGDVCDHRWPRRPVEILFLDVMKTVPVQSAVTARWFPRLLPQESILIQQDYVHEWQPWIIVSMELLRDCFTPLDYFDYGSAVFLCERVPSRRALAAADVARLPLGIQLAAMERAETRVPREYAAVIRLAKAKLLVDHGRFDDAHALVCEVRRQWPDDPRAARVGGEMIQYAEAEQERVSRASGADCTAVGAAVGVA